MGNRLGVDVHLGGPGILQAKDLDEEVEVVAQPGQALDLLYDTDKNGGTRPAQWTCRCPQWRRPPCAQS